MSKIMSNSRHKQIDKTTSVRLSPLANRQLTELEEFTGENKSRVVIRAIDLLHEKYIGSINHAEDNSTRKRKSACRAKV